MELQIKDNKIFAPLKNKELILTPEERVRQEYICRLVNHYGYDLAQMGQELQVNNSNRGQGKARADIVVWKSASAKSNEDAAAIVVECKAEHITIREDDYFPDLVKAHLDRGAKLLENEKRYTKDFYNHLCRLDDNL